MRPRFPWPSPPPSSLSPSSHFLSSLLRTIYFLVEAQQCSEAPSDTSSVSVQGSHLLREHNSEVKLHQTPAALLPFFVLHKSLPQKCEGIAPGSTRTRRKIDLPSPTLSQKSPTSPQKSDTVADSVGSNDAIYQQLRLDSFNIAWSKIDTTIKEVLRRINVNLFEEVHKWALKSFSSFKSFNMRSTLEIGSSYPLLNAVICKQIPTALVLTKNAEFVDDVLTFRELGEHMKSMRFHTANLSVTDFCAKSGIAGCLRALLKELVMDAPDVGDMSMLLSWYCEPDNSGRPIIIVIDDMERCSGPVLADFIRMLSEWTIKLPVIFIMGVATIGTAKKHLPSNALQHLQPCKFSLGSPFERMNALVEDILVNSSCGFIIGHSVAVFLRNYFLEHDGTITSFVRALKLACVKHFSIEPMSFLGIGMLDENYEVSLRGKCSVLPNSILKYGFDLPSCKSVQIRGEDSESSIDDLAKGLSELRRLLKAWSSVILNATILGFLLLACRILVITHDVDVLGRVINELNFFCEVETHMKSEQCLFEVGKHNRMQLLDIFCDVTDTTLSSLKSSSNNLGECALQLQNPVEGSLYFNGGSISQLIYKVRELPVASLSKLLDLWSVHTADINEIHSRVRELQSMVKSANSGRSFQEKQINSQRMKLSVSVGKVSVNDKAADLLDVMVRKFLTPIESRCFHEVVCFRNVDILQAALIGNPRREIQVNLLKYTTYIKGNRRSSYENALSPVDHDTSIIYNLAQEYGDLINLQDWYHSFKSTILNTTNKSKCQSRHSPVSKKVKSAASENEASIQARFCRAVTELQITGLLRMPSKKRPDFIQRVAFGL